MVCGLDPIPQNTLSQKNEDDFNTHIKIYMDIDIKKYAGDIWHPTSGVLIRYGFFFCQAKAIKFRYQSKHDIDSSLHADIGPIEYWRNPISDIYVCKFL